MSGPYIDWAALSPVVALTGGAILVLLAGLLRSVTMRAVGVPMLTVITLLATAGLGIWRWGENTSVISGALAIDDLTLALTMLFVVGGIAAVLLAYRSQAPVEAGHGEFHALLLFSVLGMFVLVGAQNLVALFLGFELLSIPLYVLCATHMRREHSLESGLKYLIIGSVGSATLVYGLALLYGSAGSTDYSAINRALTDGPAVGDVLFLTGLALIITGLAFKASVAPFHQWTPDVYEGAPTPITAFMAVATKAAAFGVLLRLFDTAVINAVASWGPALATLAAVTIVVGNVGALGQSSLKRLLAYSSIAQAGYMLVGVVVSTRLGVQATVFYLAVYLLMNLAAFAVIVARERETGRGDDLSTLNGLGADRPLLAWPITIAMLALAGFPATAGFFGKIFLIQAAVDNGYAWLAVAIVLGSAASLAYYLRVVAAVWTRGEEQPRERPAAVPAGVGGRPAIAGGAPEADRDPGAVAASARLLGEDGERGAAPGPAGLGERVAQPEVVFVALACAVATIVFGIWPTPLLEVARDAGEALRNLV
jgi:NADH-quinone oxidoreductase subunit N